MDFDTYKTWREDVLTRHTPQRFDCLNPFLAMDFTRRWTAATSQKDPQEACAAWVRLHHAQHGAAHWRPTPGVRASLGALFARAQDKGMEIWLPRDVYPFYIQEATRQAPQAKIRHFQAFPHLQDPTIAQAGPSAMLVITHPLSPAGGFLSAREASILKKWVQGGPDRWLVLDGVYLYANRLPRSFFPGFGTDRILALFSLSKSWLLRGVFGTIGGPTLGDPWWHDIPAPSGQASADALAALQEDPNMPVRQRAVFQAEWNRRGRHLLAFSTPAMRPGAGYLRPVHIDAREALERHNLLLAPASIFGHPDPSWSVASCLYEAAAQHARR